MAILLIGSTGNGKSTLGNFLIDPSEEVLFEKQYFKTAQTNLPETQNVLQVCFEEKCSGKPISVIDTPGLNESDIHDLKHMIQIVVELQKVDQILACVFVVKFNTKIDTHYKETVRYYRKLLPSLFERNVIIVMTDYATDERSEAMRKRQRIDVDQIKRNTIREIVESGSLDYQPLLFMIDCLPFNDEERKLNLEERKAILNKITAQRPFKSSDLTVAKTPHLKTKDNETMKSYEGEITGYNKRLQQVNIRAKEALENYQNKQQIITDRKKDINRMINRLKEIDSPELIVVAGWSVSDSWKILRRLTDTFDIKSPCEIEGVTKWTNGRCEWKDYQETEFRVKGKVEGRFMRGIYASISLETSKRNKYKVEVDELKSDKRSSGARMEELMKNLDDVKDRYKEYVDDINLLEKFIEEKIKLIEFLDSDYLTLDEAKKCVADLL